MDVSAGAFRPRDNLHSGRAPPTYFPMRSAEEVEAVLERIVRETGFKLERETGLRRLTAPPETDPDGQNAHRRGREIFVGEPF